MPANLENYAVIVTGASSGLGRATALTLASAGADVVLVARSEGDLQTTAAEVTAMGRGALVQAADLSDPEIGERVVSHTVKTFGRVDGLVNSAATDAPAPVETLQADAWDRVMAVNLRASFLLSKAVFPHLRRAGSGLIVNISSVAGKRGWAEASAYCTTKFGLTGFTQALAAEGKPHGIRACVLYPGAMDTAWGAWTPEARREHGEETNDEALNPSAVADLIVFLFASPQNFVLNEGVVTPVGERGWP